MSPRAALFVAPILGFVVAAMVAGMLEASGASGGIAFGSRPMLGLWAAASAVAYAMLARASRPRAEASFHPLPPPVRPSPPPTPSPTASPIDAAQTSGSAPHPRTLREMQRQYQKLYDEQMARQHRRS